MPDTSGNYMYPLRDVMDAIFSYYAAGINFRAKVTNGKPFVLFAKNNLQQLHSQNQKILDYKQLPYLYEHIKYLYDYLCKFKEATIIDTPQDAAKEAVLLNSLNQIEDLLETQKIDDITQLFLSLYQIILDFWDNTGLCNWTYTFRLLACMARIQSWNDTSATRTQLCEIIHTLADTLI